MQKKRPRETEKERARQADRKTERAQVPWRKRYTARKELTRSNLAQIQINRHCSSIIYIYT